MKLIYLSLSFKFAQTIFFWELLLFFILNKFFCPIFVIGANLILFLSCLTAEIALKSKILF